MLGKSMRGTHRNSIEKQWKGLVAIGVLMAANIAFNNSSLVNMSLSLNQIIRASIPVVTAIVAVVVEHQIPGKGEAAGLLVLTGGVMLSVYEGTAVGSPYAIFCCIAGTICNGAMMSFSGRLLSEKLDVLRLAFYTAPVSLGVLLPLFYLQEAARIQQYMVIHGRHVYILVTLSSMLALIYNVVHSLMILHTSAVSTTVIGEAKIIGLLILSYFVLGEKKVFTPNLWIGCMLAIGGFCLYSHFKLRAIQCKAAEVASRVGVEAESQPLVPSATQLTKLSPRSPGSRV
ncbi:g2111 [Coccomyxa elongata]